MKKSDTVIFIVLMLAYAAVMIDAVFFAPPGAYTEGAQVSGDPVRAVQQR